MDEKIRMIECAKIEKYLEEASKNKRLKVRICTLQKCRKCKKKSDRDCG